VPQSSYQVTPSRAALCRGIADTIGSLLIPARRR